MTHGGSATREASSARWETAASSFATWEWMAETIDRGWDLEDIWMTGDIFWTGGEELDYGTGVVLRSGLDELFEAE